MKKLLLLFVSFLIIGFAVSMKINKQKSNSIAVNKEPIIRLKEESIIVPPLIIEEKKDIQIKPKPIIKRDLNIMMMRLR